MAYDLFSGAFTQRDWSLGASDLPAKARGYAPTTFWKPPQMEAKLAEILGQPKSMFSSDKPDRKEAITMLAAYMKANKIGPSEVAGGIGAEVGSLVLTAKDRDKLLNKIDDVRFDIRNFRFTFGVAFFALAGAITFGGLSKLYERR